MFQKTARRKGYIFRIYLEIQGKKIIKKVIKPRLKGTLTRLPASHMSEVLYETLILGDWQTLTRDSCRKSRTKRSFWRLDTWGDLTRDFWRKSRTKRSFWRQRLGTWLSVPQACPASPTQKWVPPGCRSTEGPEWRYRYPVAKGLESKCHSTRVRHVGLGLFSTRGTKL